MVGDGTGYAREVCWNMAALKVVADSSFGAPASDLGLIGRDKALATLCAGWKAGTRLWTLVGPGGMGKTRLARHLAERGPAELRGPFCRFCDASEVRDAESLIAVVQRAAAPDQATVTGSGNLDAGAALRRLGPSLFVLDNAEQVADICSKVLPIWLEHAPLVRLLVTSRRMLGVPGEAVYSLEPLAADPPPGQAHGDAVELMVRRARHVRPSFSPLPADIAILTQIAAALDGIPLALELAAARLAILTPDALWARLERDVGSLGDNTLDRPARHATLRAVVEWSWALLPAAEQLALLRLAVFRRGASVDAAEAVLGAFQNSAESPDHPEPLSLVVSLARHSLLHVDFAEGARYHLYESVRDFALGRLQQSDAPIPEPEVREVHATYFASEGWARGAVLERTGDIQAWHWLDTEVNNLQAAADWTLRLAASGSPGGAVERAAALVMALEPVLLSRGPHHCLSAYLDVLLALPGLSALWSARAWLAKGKLLRQRGDAASARDALDVAVKWAREAEWLDGEARAALEGGIAAHHVGHTAHAAAQFQRAEALFFAEGLSRERARAWGSLAVIRHEEGQLEQAEQLYEAALTEFREAKDARSQAVFLSNLGDLHKDQGRIDLAKSEFEEGLDLARRAGDRRVEGVLLGNLGGIEEERQNFEAARQLRLAAALIQDEMGDRRTAAIFRGLAARIDHLVGDFEVARRHYRSAVRILAEAGERRYESLLRANLALVAAQTQRPAEARAEMAAARNRASVLAEPQLVLSLDAHAALIDWTLASTSESRGAIDAVGDRLRALGVGAGDEARFALLWVRRAVGEDSAPVTLVANREMSQFRIGANPPVSLARRHVLRRIFARLLAARAECPGERLELDAVFEAGWPGEMANASAAANRVYVAITTLRKLGLGNVLENYESGWRLDPHVPFRWVDASKIDE